MKEFTLHKLIEASQLKLEALSHKQSDSRIKSIPDIRTLRYYQSLGLVSKPARYEGREAIYTSRHLEQLILVKILQMQGYSLSQVQKRMACVPPEKISSLFHSLTNESPTEVNSHQPRRLICVEISTGIQITIDPQIIKNPEHIIEQLTIAISTEQL